MPELIGNPLYIWCALELKRYFGIGEPLGAWNAKEIWHRTKELIAERHITPQYCMEQSRVELVCTTEDPADSLVYHRKMKERRDGTVRVIPAFRPDKAFYVEKDGFAEYIATLSEASGVTIRRFADLTDALEKRLLYFQNTGSMISDHGIEDFFWAGDCETDADAVFQKALAGEKPDTGEIARYRSTFLVELGKLYQKHGFVMQLHIGTYQGANRSEERRVGAACGFDCIDDGTSIKSVGALLNRLTECSSLPRTILYPLDASQMETFAVLAAGFCEGPWRGKVQLGAPWWFHDQPAGIRRQFEYAANLYPVALSVGMLTDSRSFLSYPRHELYRRVLCDYFGALVERGEYFSPEEELGRVIQNICYYNAKGWFGFDGKEG